MPAHIGLKVLDNPVDDEGHTLICRHYGRTCYAMVTCMKSLLLKDHFFNPRGMGFMDNPTHYAVARSEVCNDVVRVMVRIDDDGILLDVKAQVYGCGYAIAGASIFNSCARGMGMERAAALRAGDLLADAGDIPERHVACVGLALKAFQKIYDDYRRGLQHGTS